YNETRDVASTRPGILLPQSIYFDRSRTFGLAADGVQVYGERRTPMGDFYLQAGVGFPQTRNDDLEVTIFTRDLPGEFEGEASLIGRLLYEWEGGRVRAGLSYADVTLDFEPVPPLPGGSFNFEPLIASLQFNGERWSLTSEYARRASRLRGLGIGGGGTDFTGESYYVQATYRLPHDWEALLRYDVFFADRDDRDGRRFAARDPLRRPDHSRFAKDWTLGLNWNLTPQFSLRAEWHHVDGTGWLTIQDNADLRATERRWNLLAILASYRF
nr:OprO/OprP family phosphate-selective porin [Pseudomonadota bacterium]